MSALGARLALLLAAPVAAGCTLSLDYLESGPSNRSGVDSLASDGGAGGGTEPVTSEAARPDAPDATTAFDAGAAGDGGNLVVDPGFESGLGPWIVWDGASIAVTTARAHGGSACARVTGRTHTYQGPVQDITARVSPGAIYQGAAWAMVGAGGGAAASAVAEGGAAPGGDAASDAAADAGDASVRAGDAAVDAGDASVRAGDAAADSGAGGGGSPTLQQPVNLTAKIGCAGGGGVTYTYEQIGSATANGAGWVLIAGGFSVPSCNLVSLSVYTEGPAAGFDLYVDDVSVW